MTKRSAPGGTERLGSWILDSGYENMRKERLDDERCLVQLEERGIGRLPHQAARVCRLSMYRFLRAAICVNRYPLALRACSFVPRCACASEWRGVEGDGEGGERVWNGGACADDVCTGSHAQPAHSLARVGALGRRGGSQLSEVSSRMGAHMMNRAPPVSMPSHPPRVRAPNTHHAAREGAKAGGDFPAGFSRAFSSLHSQ